MRIIRIVSLSTGIALLAACSANEVDQPPVHGRPAARDYITTDQLTASGGSPGTAAFNVTMDGFFLGDNSAYKTVAQLSWAWLSDLSSTTQAWIIKNSDGSELNRTSNGFSGSMMAPVSSDGMSLVAQASTLARICGVTGKGDNASSAAQKLKDPQQNNALVTFWTSTRNPPAPDKTLRDCVPPHTHITATGTSLYANEGGDLDLDAPQYVSFDGSGSTGGDYSITGYEWYDDGSGFSSNASTGTNVEPGDYEFALTAHDDYDNATTVSVEVTVADTSFVDNGQGGGGGDNGPETCYDLYLHWPDGSQPDMYIGSECCDNTRCYES